MAEEFPSPDTRGWAIRRKAIGTYAVEKKIISLEDACQRYGISLEEFESWRRLIEQHVIGGLQVTRLAQYRNEPNDNRNWYRVWLNFSQYWRSQLDGRAH